jgi:hypothetical protein
VGRSFLGSTKDRATMLLDDQPKVVNDPFGERSVWDGVPLSGT